MPTPRSSIVSGEAVKLIKKYNRPNTCTFTNDMHSFGLTLDAYSLRPLTAVKVQMQSIPQIQREYEHYDRSLRSNSARGMTGMEVQRPKTTKTESKLRDLGIATSAKSNQVCGWEATEVYIPIGSSFNYWPQPAAEQPIVEQKQQRLQTHSSKVRKANPTTPTIQEKMLQSRAERRSIASPREFSSLPTIARQHNEAKLRQVSTSFGTLEDVLTVSAVSSKRKKQISKITFIKSSDNDDMTLISDERPFSAKYAQALLDACLKSDKRLSRTFEVK